MYFENKCQTNIAERPWLFSTQETKAVDLQKKKRVKFPNYVLNHYIKDETRRWLFSNEKFFDLDEVYNSQNDQVWAASREEANEKGDLHETTKFPAENDVVVKV